MIQALKYSQRKYAASIRDDEIRMAPGLSNSVLPAAGGDQDVDKPRWGPSVCRRFLAWQFVNRNPAQHPGLGTLWSLPAPAFPKDFHLEQAGSGMNTGPLLDACGS